MKITLKPLYCLLALTLVFRAAIAQVPSYVPTSGLLMYYAFNSSAYDLSSHGVNGTVSGPTYTTDRFGTPNAAVNFTGSGEVITTHHIDRATTNTFTYSVWVNPGHSTPIPAAGTSSGLTDSQSYSCVIAPVDGWNWSSGASDVGAGLVVANNGVYVMEHGQSITNVSLSWTGSLNGWHYIVVEYISKEPYLYVDGSYVTSGYTSSYTVHPSMACDSFYDGYYPYLTAGFGHGLYPIVVPTYNYAGDIDDMSIYNRALTACEITQLYDTGSSIITVTGLSSLCPGSSTVYSVSTTGGYWSTSNTGVAVVGSGTGLVTATGSGVCNISYTTGSGCSGIQAVSVNVLPNVVAPASLCIGASATLTIPVTGGYWACGPQATIGSASGVLTGVSVGTCHISYVLPTGCYAPTAVSINAVPPVPTGATQVCAGAATALTNSMAGGSWTSSSSYATAGSLTGTITGITAGTVTITYTLTTGCSVTEPFTVNPLPAVITGTASVCPAQTTTLSDATPGGTWASGTTSVATIGSGSGIVSGVAAGASIVTYTLTATGCKATRIVTVNPLPGSISGASVICQGTTSSLTDAGSGTWSSSASSIATILSGTLSGVSAGTAVITYTLATTCMATYPITINPVPVAIMGTFSECVGAATTLTDGTLGGTWGSGSTTIATAGSGTGLVTGIAGGASSINYTLPTGCAVSAIFTVNPAPAPIGGVVPLCVGQTTTLSDFGSGSWTSASPSVATVVPGTGFLTAASPGTSLITYTLPTGCSITATETVNGVPLPITGTTFICAGSTATFSDPTTGGAWSSSNTAVGIIGSLSGVMTGSGPGTTVITYTLASGCSVSIGVTVNPLPGAIWSPDSLCVGLTATLTDAGSGTWTSSNPAVATIGSSSGFVSALVPGSTTITYTLLTGCHATSPLTVDPLPTGISGATSLCSGATTPLSDVTPGGSWASSDYTIAYIDPGTGLVTGYSGGPATIIYSTVSGCTASFSISVNPLPATISGMTSVCTGATTSLFDAGGTWSVTPSSMASINMVTGVLTGISAGTATVTYTLPTGCLTTLPVLVNASPVPISGPAGMCLGITGLMTDATPGGLWSSSDPFLASIYTTSGVIIAGGVGVTTISYTLGTGCSSQTTVTIDPSPAVIAGTATVCAGATTSLFDAGGTWSCTPASLGTINAATGVLTGISAGTATVTYTLPTGCLATLPVVVKAAPGPISGPAGMCEGLTSVMTDATPGGSWGSSNPFVASIYTISGVTTATGIGFSTISYTLGTGCSSSITVTVNSSPGPITGTMVVCPTGTTLLSNSAPGGVWSITPSSTATIGSSTGMVTGISPGSAIASYSLGAGCTVTATVIVNPMPGPISGTPVVCAGSSVLLGDGTPGGTWASASGTIATAGSLTGVIYGASAGTSTITYSLSPGCYRTITATVNPQPPAISGSGVVCPGTSASLSDLSPGGSWSSTPAGIAAVGSSGTVTGILAGAATVSYTLTTTGCAVTKAVTVYPLPGAISGPLQVCAGYYIILADGGGGTWSTGSGAASIGTSSGILTGLSAGISPVTYTLATGCMATADVIVNALPAPIGGPSAVCAGATVALTDTGSGTWSSSLPTIATVVSGGIVTGVTTGAVVINYTSVAGCTATKPVTVSGAPGAIAGPAGVCAGGTIALSDALPGGTWSSSTPAAGTIGALTGIVSGGTGGLSTTITYSLGAGCTVTKIVSVTPSPAAIGGSSGLCIGGTTPLSDVTTGGTWTSTPTTVATISGTGTVTGIVAGTATIDYTVGGCSSSKVITVNTTPSAISGPSVVCAGGTITETDGTSGLWSATSTFLSIGTTGVVTGIAAGTGIITCGVGSCQATKAITVNALAAISGPTGYCTGATGTLTASVAGGSWLSGLTTVATAGAGTGLVTAAGPGTAVIYYTLPTGCSSNVTITVNSAPGAISGIKNVCAGSTTPLGDIAGGGLWSITPGTTAAIGSSSGVVSGMVSGTATVTYSLGSGCTVTTIVTVNPLPLPVSGIGSVCAGLVTSLTDATPGGTWYSAGTGVAGVGATTGTVTGASAGTAVIDYALPTGCLSSTTVTVNPAPAAISGVSALCAGATAPFSDLATGGTWSSTAITVASVGTGGIVSGGVAGIATISYTLPTGCVAAKAVTVNSAPLAITGGSSVCIGSAVAQNDLTPGGAWSSSTSSIGTVSTTGVVTGLAAGTTTITYSAAGCLTTKVVSVNTLPPPISGLGQVCIGTTITKTDAASGGVWSCSNPLVALAGSSTGVITGVEAGTATITYSMGAGCNVYAPVTVNGLPLSITGAPGICTGSTSAYTDATPGGTWSSSNPSVGTVSTLGILHGISGGSATVSYTALLGCAATQTVTVVTVPAITGVHNMCAWGDTMNVSDLITTGLFTSSLATISNLGSGNGRLTANTPGTGSVTYISPMGCTATATFTVNPIPGPISGSTGICAGSTLTLADATSGGAWSSGSISVATAGSGTGVITGISGGTAIIYYTLPTGCKVDTPIVVSPLPPAITGAASVFIGTPITLADAGAGGVWTSSSTAVATVVASTGHVTGIAVGSVNITYTEGGMCSVTKYITVMPPAPGHKSSYTAEEETFKVWPNPAHSSLNITTDDGGTASLLNIAGQCLGAYSLQAGANLIALPTDISDGVYVLEFTPAAGEKKVVRLVIGK